MIFVSKLMVQFCGGGNSPIAFALKPRCFCSVDGIIFENQRIVQIPALND